MTHPGIKKIQEGAYLVIDPLLYMNQITPFDLTLANQTISGGIGVEIVQWESFVPLAPENREWPQHDEAWLLKNRSALKSIIRGLEQAENRELVDRGSFAEYADEEID